MKSPTPVPRGRRRARYDRLLPCLPVALALLGLFALAGGLGACGGTEAATYAPGGLTLALESARPLPPVEALALESVASPGVPRRRFTLEPGDRPGAAPLALALPPGRYAHLELTLAAAAGGRLALPVALPLDPPLELHPGEERALVVELTWSDEASGHPEVRIIDPVAGGSLAGALVAADGQVDGARVLALSAGERDPAEALASTVADEGGAFLLRGLRPGTYDLRAERGPVRGAALQVALAAGETRNLILELAE